MNGETILVGVTFLMVGACTIHYFKKPTTPIKKTKLRYKKYSDYPLPLYSNKV
jgi:hypothetical protein